MRDEGRWLFPLVGWSADVGFGRGMTRLLVKYSHQYVSVIYGSRSDLYLISLIWTGGGRGDE